MELTITTEALPEVERWLADSWADKGYTVADAGDGHSTITFAEPLTNAQKHLFDQVVAEQEGRSALPPERRAAVKDDVANMKAYLNASAPTQAQTVTVVKSMIRVIRAMMNDSA